ncbi:MAG: dihydroorotase, partial [Bacteroidetes bacterium HGW-Bacteroidetes-22]
LRRGLLDVVATDHAPHTLPEKALPYSKAPSGGPLVQHSLVAMLEMARQGKIEITEVIRRMCHTPADLFRIDRRGYLREGFYADMVLVDQDSSWTVAPENILYKCGWSPFEGTTFHNRVDMTFVNGQLAYDKGKLIDSLNSMRLIFNR